ncbi:MAG: hypothetical protein JO257_07715 [Deltaproteobacteria bacterium]|nr:hypothetical protein [Deltaproteobacteria bacterium]
MANFRTTLWFKKGELDAAAAHDPEGTGAADLLPIEDRYADDGSVSGEDRAAFSLGSGHTQALALMKQTAQIAPVSAPPPEVVSELKGGRMRVIAALGAAIVMLVLAVYAF